MILAATTDCFLEGVRVSVQLLSYVREVIKLTKARLSSSSLYSRANMDSFQLYIYSMTLPIYHLNRIYTLPHGPESDHPN